MATAVIPYEMVPEITMTSFDILSAEAEQRGRKRCRDPTQYLHVTSVQVPSGESATFRGRSRRRSVSRLDVSRKTSRARGGSISPSRRKLLRVTRLDRRRSQSPSRARLLNGQDLPKRRRPRTRSSSREHDVLYASSDQPSSLRNEFVVVEEMEVMDDLVEEAEEALDDMQDG